MIEGFVFMNMEASIIWFLIFRWPFLFGLLPTRLARAVKGLAVPFTSAVAEVP